ncbi:MAG: hypothetical protein BV459_00375 [Thermoplasmata archaeon M11B2D]|nr:MAG: hypothetical protein BV459_00375 [Thermoplasmata archaeon M11B2D]
MATNPWTGFHSASPEQNMLMDLTIETIKFNGMDILYSHREVVNLDSFYNEDIESQFNDAKTIEMLIESVDGFEGDADFLSRFGLSIKDKATFVVARRRFAEVFPNLERPREGDLIWLPMSKGLLEITHVEDESPFYPLGSLTVFKLSCEMFKYSQEVLDTGYPEIDSVEDIFENADDSSKDPFARNDIIEQEASNIVDFTEDNPFGNL